MQAALRCRVARTLTASTPYATMCNPRSPLCDQSTVLEKPVLNRPYAHPNRRFNLGAMRGLWAKTMTQPSLSSTNRDRIIIESICRLACVVPQLAAILSSLSNIVNE